MHLDFITQYPKSGDALFRKYKLFENAILSLCDKKKKKEKKMKYLQTLLEDENDPSEGRYDSDFILLR